MRLATSVGGFLVFLLAALVATGADPKPVDTLKGLKKEIEVAWKCLDDGRKPGTPEAEEKAAVHRYCKEAAAIARRALVLAEDQTDPDEAAVTVAWVLGGLGAYSANLDAECDAAYDVLAERYLDKDAILPVVRIAWTHSHKTAHAELFHRAAVERSANAGVRALACFSLGRHQQQLAALTRLVDDAISGTDVQKHMGPENVRRIRSLKPEDARREAESLFERTLKEFAKLQPMGTDFPPLGEQARGALFRLRNLEIGCKAPEIEAGDVDGKPLKLSDSRGKVVMISFWATWCGPCMGMVPQERALVSRMKGRPFVLLGVNGDDDLATAKSVSAKEGITWRSFSNGGPHGPISLQWGVSGWPTVYLIDAQGIIRHDTLRGPNLDKAVEDLVAEAEASDKKPR
jgi:peroxiredoxin